MLWACLLQFSWRMYRNVYQFTYTISEIHWWVQNCGTTVWTLLHVPLLAPRIWSWCPDLCKICEPPVCVCVCVCVYIYVCLIVTIEWKHWTSWEEARFLHGSPDKGPRGLSESYCFFDGDWTSGFSPATWTMYWYKELLYRATCASASTRVLSLFIHLSNLPIYDTV